MVRFAVVAVLFFGIATARADGPQLLGQPREDYAARRKALMAEVTKAEAGRSRRPGQTLAEPVIILRGEDDRNVPDFEEGRFRQENAFAYLTGVDVPGAYLILLANSGRETLYLPPVGGHPVMNGDATGPTPGPQAAESLGIARVESTDKLLGDLFAAIADPMSKGRSMNHLPASVYTLDPQPKPDATDGRSRFVRFLHDGAPTATFRNLAPVLGELRKAKTPAELALLRRAIAITGDAQTAVTASIRPAQFEFQLEGRVVGAFLQGGAMRSGFKSIIGSGLNGTIPHYFLSARQMQDGDLVVVDIGAEYQLYTADITRTYPVNGTFTPRQREIYQLVLDTQTEAARAVKPGTTKLSEMTAIARDFMQKSPLRAKDVDGQEYTMDHFFIHGLGHYLGMDVHDVGDEQQPIQPGEVFTIEPGIYIKPEAIGIRIEDDYLATPVGVEKLSEAIPFTPDAIERAIAEGKSNGAKHAD